MWLGVLEGAGCFVSLVAVFRIIRRTGNSYHQPISTETTTRNIHPRARPINTPPQGQINRGYIYSNTAQIQSPTTALQFYAQTFPHLSVEEWNREFLEGRIITRGFKGNNAPVLETKINSDYEIRRGEKLAYYKPPWREPAVPLDLPVLYEDDHILAVNKPAGLQVLPGGGFQDSTVLGILKRRSDIPCYPVHRLGRGTSGVLLCAKSQIGRRKLSKDFKDHKVVKIYRALVEGIVSEDKIDVRAPIGPLKSGPFKGINAYVEDGKASYTILKVLKRDVKRNESLVEADIQTGRPHQIRIHCAFTGHPLVADPFYAPGGRPVWSSHDSAPPRIGDVGYWLHSMRLEVAHPMLGQKLVLVAPVPGELGL
ncbi:hypothetical protein AAMO2058_000118700 [Amorphochlora amoebiformis]|uniref:Pseudouridine synthase n=1 Tax=Amorphochlora amoebiformis TaxID=1561963 RepID=A0A7S0CPE2_9EUKA|mmetsp:Transcript_11260/g.17790  ORF Transcript_11260/g.17790 Transcript_11260/m.17790 type:complete len:368 (+) Transcript_11260:110-1213(+)